MCIIKSTAVNYKATLNEAHSCTGLGRKGHSCAVFKRIPGAFTQGLPDLPYLASGMGTAAVDHRLYHASSTVVVSPALE